MDEPITFGSWLKRRRRGLGLTQAELARQVGYVTVTIRKLEADELRPSLQAAARLAEALAIPSEERAQFIRFARDEQQSDALPGPAPGPALPEPHAVWRCGGHLPVQLSSFIGRQRELEQIRQLLAGTRLLTLTGVGGTGKTRLALQLASQIEQQFGEGVWLVELAPLGDPQLLPQTLASALGLHLQAGQDPIGLLVKVLRERQLLLLLDNCEHLLAACAQLAEVLLHSCPQLQILATSREALGIPGETSYPVPSLSAPPPGATLEQLLSCEAAQLFLDRARAVQPAFMASQANAPRVAEICLRLDGIPLALELAAARLRHLPLEQLAARLDQRFRLLTGGSRTALPRQQTLQATIDWSFELLGLAERRLFWRLAVFVDGWTLEAAEQVCGDALQPEPAHEPPQVLELLGHLVDKSLVLFEAPASDGLAQGRYRFLETIRAYAREKLLASGETEQLHDRHLACFVALAEQAEPQLWSAAQVAWLDRLEAEHDNLRAALRWSLAQEAGPERSGQGARLTRALWWFWHLRGFASEGTSYLERALSCAADHGGMAAAARAHTLAKLALLLQMNGEARRAAPLLQEALALAQASQDRWALAAAQFGLGRFAIVYGDIVDAPGLLEAALALFEELGDPWGRRDASGDLGKLAETQGQLDQALSWYRRSLAIARSTGDTDGMAYALHLLASVLLRRGEYAQAADCCAEGLALARLTRQPWTRSELLQLQSWLAQLRGEDLQTQAPLQELRSMLHSFNQQGASVGRGYLLFSLGMLEVQHGQIAQAVGHFKASLRLFQELDQPAAIALCLVGLAAGGVRAELSPTVLLPAVRLLGAAARILASLRMELPVSSIYTAMLEQTIAVARQRLDAAAFEATWHEGQAMTLDEVVDYALATAQPM